MALVSRRTALRVLGVVFMLLAAQDLIQVADVAAGESDEPQMLVLEHLVCGVVAVTAAVGLWRGARWASYAALGWGICTAALLLTLTPLLDLPPESRSGMWAGVAGVLVFVVLVAWYAWPSAMREPSEEGHDGSA
jgi:hypothetical protein